MTDRSVPRRRFLAAAAASAGLGMSLRPLGALADRIAPRPAPAPHDPAAPTPAVRLGIASYSLRKFPLETALTMMKTLRTPYVNFKSVHVPYDRSPAELAAIRRQIEAAGFTIVGGGTITFDKDTDEDVRRYFDYAKAAGMPLIVGTGAPSVLPRVEKFIKEYDIKVAIHNHGPEDKHFPSPYDVLRHVEHMDHRLGLCMDIGHTERTGTDPVKAATDAGPRLLDMHAKDLRDLSAKDSQCAVGDGKLPIADLFRALESIGYAGYVNLEYEIEADDPLPGMKQSFAHMRGVLAGLAPAGSRMSGAQA